MSEGTLDDRYFEWLYAQIGAVQNRNPSRLYWRLAKQCYTTPFFWSVPNDDNRIEDGKELRSEFLHETGVFVQDPSWLDLECSMLEMLIALARRASFESFGEPGDWFWLFMRNLGLADYTDHRYTKHVERKVQQCLEQVIFRTYSYNGEGGLFPLQHPRQDQRHVELWYQLGAFILEGDYIDHGPVR